MLLAGTAIFRVFRTGGLVKILFIWGAALCRLCCSKDGYFVIIIKCIRLNFGCGSTPNSAGGALKAVSDSIHDVQLRHERHCRNTPPRWRYTQREQNRVK